VFLIEEGGDEQEMIYVLIDQDGLDIEENLPEHLTKGKGGKKKKSRRRSSSSDSEREERKNSK